ncbi:MAG: zinc-binding dehydrogenase [Nitrospinota bacterium]
MKAIFFNEYGGREVLKYEDIDTPKPGPTEALVKVGATSMNWYEVMARKGDYKPFKSFPHVLGGDVAGEVVEVGADVTNLTVGQRVVLFVTVNCKQCELCLNGDTHLCIRRKYYGAHLWGGYAQYVKAYAENWVPLGPGVSYEDAAAFSMTYVTAWHQLVTRAGLKPGEDVLVHSAGSGVSVAAIQIAKWAGCRAFTTSSSDEKCEQALEMGADFAINYRDKDVVEEIKRLTDKRGVDVVVDNMGENTWDQSIRCLVRGGRLTTCGGTTGYNISTNLAHIFHKELTVIGSNYGLINEMKTLVKLLEKGAFKVAIDRVLPLKDAAEGQRILEARENFGKVVLVPEF